MFGINQTVPCPVEQFEATVSQSTVPSPPLTLLCHILYTR